MVCAGFFWEIIYLDVCQLEPFYQLTQPEGVTLKASLSLDYMTSFTWFVPFRAFRQGPHRHTAVGLASIVNILVGMVLPATTAGMLKIQWMLSTSGAAVTVLPAFAILNILVLLASITCGVWLYLVLYQRRTGIYSAPASISSIAALVSGSNILQAFQKLHSYDTQARIDEALGHCRLRLEHRPGHDNPYQIRLLDPIEDLTVPPEQPFRPTRAEAHSWWLWGRTYVGSSLLILALEIIFASVSLGKSYTTSTTIRRILTTILNVSAAALWSNWHTNIALLEPYYRLAKGKTTTYSAAGVSDPYCRIEPRKHLALDGTNDALHLEFTSSAISNLITSTRKATRAGFVGFIGFCVLILQLSIITTPAFINVTALITALLSSSSTTGLTLSIFTANWPTVIPRSIIIDWWFSIAFIFIQAISLFVGLVLVLVYKRTPIMPRKPYTYSSVVLYLCNSAGLLGDLAGTSVMEKKERDGCLRRRGGRYGIGWVTEGEGEDEGCRVAIERIEEVRAGYVFGEVMSERAR
ncbi:hypothetical protein ES702_01834 [subsurface metagenome]